MVRHRGLDFGAGWGRGVPPKVPPDLSTMRPDTLHEWPRKSNTCLNLVMRSFPDDLAQAQQEWSATYRQLAERPGRTELRRAAPASVPAVG